MMPPPDVLRARARMMKKIREFFDARDFVEVETPVRLHAPAPEHFIDCPPVATGGFLRASPELQMKKLLASGLDRIYQMGPCFRDGEIGARHQPEFAMLEWYRREKTYREIADDLTALMQTLAKEFAISPEPYREIPRVKIRDVYREKAGWDPFDAWDADRFDFDMATKIEPELKKFAAVFLTDYPPQAASLARLRDGVAERWEFYVDGLELANCFSELCDATEQRARFEISRQARRESGEADYPFDEEFFAILPRIESAAGVALGLDRLAMILLGFREISSVRAGQ